MPDSPILLDAARVRQKLSGTRMPADPLAVDLRDIGQRLPAALLENLGPTLRPAGVLIPLIEHAGALSVLLTERAADLRHHAGQVSFPGGGMEAQDTDIRATALREAWEEVGIHPDAVEIAGFLEPTPTVTGFAVTPVVGLVAPTFELKVDPLEVARAFEVPLEFLMDARNEVHSERDFGGIRVPVVSFHYGAHRIWGATAGILISLRRLLL